ncbi:MAG: response regulator transcription factor [Cyanobacteriota bacterium]|nr:response regulator transcription factor [Cyanobacteriota bacterium]
MRIEAKEHISPLKDFLSLGTWNHKVLVACGHKPLAMSLATCIALESAGGTDHLLGVCTTASDTLELLESQSQPVLVMISEVLDDSSGLELLASIQQLAEQGQTIRTILTLEILNRQVLKQAARCKPNVLLSQRGFQPKVIRHALEAIVNNSAYIDPLLLHILTGDSPSEVPDLSEREIDVLELVCEGLSNREIGRRLHIADVTARQHVQAIIHKLHVRNRTASAAEAIRTHLVD